MKLSKDDLKKKISETIEDNDKAISILEDIEDSMEIPDTSELDDLKQKYEEQTEKFEELKEKYKSRFLGENNKVEDKKVDELEEEKIIDIRDI